MRRRVTSGAKGDARIQADIDGGVARRRLMPRRNNPETVGDANRLELSLGDSDPVRIFDLFVTDDFGLINMEAFDSDSHIQSEIEIVIDKNL